MKSQTTTRRAGPDDGDRSAGADAALRRGALLGRYTILEAIGSGGMGNVYSAWDPELRRRVAIKVLHGELLRSTERDRAHERLRGEARAAARLAHPNVVSIFDVGTYGDRLFLAMELVEGETLRAWLAEPRPWRDVLELFEHAGRGLAAAHRSGLVHRDFKPGNVMRSDDGRVKILDFGLAKAIQLDDEPTAETATSADGAGNDETEHEDDRSSRSTRSTALGTRTSRLVGTPIYMSPEQLDGGTVDRRSDQWSFCVSLYEALYRQRPFELVPEGETPAFDAPLEPPADSDVPRSVHRALVRGLAVDPARRHPSMDALLAALHVDRGTRRRPWLIAAALVVLAAVAAVTGGRSPSVDCADAGTSMRQVWGPARSDALRTVFAAASTPAVSTPAWTAARAALDARADALRAAYVEACEATHRRGEQSPELLDLRVACLDDRRRDLDALVRLFEDGRPETLARAASAVGSLPGLAGCADRRALTSLDAPPPDEQTAARLEAVRERLSEAKALEAAGRYPEALRLAEEALEEARALRYRPLVGDAQLQNATVVGRLGDSEGMRQLLYEALSTSISSGDRELLALTTLQLMVVAFLQDDVREGRSFARMADAAISALAGRDDLRAQHLFFSGMISIREGAFEQAAGEYERYLELDDLEDRDALYALNNYAEALRELGELERAREALLRARELTSTLAETHEMRFVMESSLAEIEIEAGQVDEGITRIERALLEIERVLGPDHPFISRLLSHLAHGYLEDDRPGEALEALERADAISREVAGYNDWPNQRRWLHGRALWESGVDRPRGLELIREAARLEAVGIEARAADDAAAWLADHGEPIERSTESR